MLHPLILGQLLHVLDRSAAATLVLHFQETLRTLALLSRLLAVAQAPWSHMVLVGLAAQGGVGGGDLQMHIGQEVAGGLHLRGIILMNLGAHG